MTHLDWAVLGATVLIGSLAGTLYGLWQLSRMDLGTWDDVPLTDAVTAGPWGSTYNDPTRPWSLP